VVHKWGKLLHITPDKLERTHNWYAHKKGRWALMFCVFAPVWRHLTAIVAGTSKMPFWEFMLCAYSGTLLWVSTFITLGFVGGSTFKRTSMHVHYALFGCSILVGIGILAYFLWRGRRDARKAAEASAIAGHGGDAEPKEQRSGDGRPDGPPPPPRR
jgi:membrane protein DedA with SNARE-associated domain